MSQLRKAIAEDQGTNSPCSGQVTMKPLQKRRLSGELYERDPKVESLIVELASLPRDELTTRAAIMKWSDPGYIPSECLIYFIRQFRHDDHQAWFEGLYRILIERVVRKLPRAESMDGKSESLTRKIVRDTVVSRLGELLSADRFAYVEQLDFYEVRFDRALAKLRLDVQEKEWREVNRSQPLEYEKDNGELVPELELAAGSTYDPFGSSDLADPFFRSRLDAAIEDLPARQRRIIYMLSQDFPIDSQDPDVMTIAKALNCSERTVRNQRNEAFATLRSAMADGDEQ